MNINKININQSEQTYNIVSDSGYLYAGIAKPTTNPGTPDGNVFYLATEVGTYTNFDGIAVKYGECAIIEYKKGTWTKTIPQLMTNAKLSTVVTYVILEWDTDVATTRKKVPSTTRKNGLQISYNHPEKGWINERYIGTKIDDSIFPVDNNLWEHIPSESDINNISSLSNVANSMGLDAVNALSDKSTISTPLLSKYTLFEFNRVKNIFVNNEVIKGKVKSVSVYCAASTVQYVFSIDKDKTFAKYLGKIEAYDADGWYDIELDVLLYDEYIGVSNVKTPYATYVEGYPTGCILTAKNTTALAEKDTLITASSGAEKDTLITASSG